MITNEEEVSRSVLRNRATKGNCLQKLISFNVSIKMNRPQGWDMAIKSAGQVRRDPAAIRWVGKAVLQKNVLSGIRPGVKVRESVLNKGKVGRSALRSRAEKDKSLQKRFLSKSASTWKPARADMKIKSAGQVSKGRATPVKCKFNQAALNPEVTAYASVHGFQSSWDRLHGSQRLSGSIRKDWDKELQNQKDADLKESESLWGSTEQVSSRTRWLKVNSQDLASTHQRELARFARTS